MGRPPKQWNAEPQRIESSARMVVADAEPVVTEPAMKAAEDVIIPPIRPVQSDPNVYLSETRMPLGTIVIEDPAIPETEVHFRNSEGETVGAIVNLAPPDPRPWQPITTALRDGTLLEARDADGTPFMMVYRRTSRHNGIRWEATGFWSSHLSREPLKVEPVEWRLPEGFLLHPGMVVA